MSVKRAEVNGISLAYETFGEPGRPPLLLVMGLGAQMIGWSDDFCKALAVGRYVVRFDNRDVGESQWLEGRWTSPRAPRATRRRPSTRSRTWPTTRSACSTRSASTRRTWSARRWAG